MAAEAVGSHGWQKIVKSVTGWKVESEVVPAVIAAGVLYLAVFLIGQILYQTTRRILPGVLRSFALDFIKTMTFCAYPFGHGIMRKYYGEPGYIGAMLPIVYISTLTFPLGDDNPITVWMKYFLKGMPLWKCLVKTVVQILGGFAAYHLGMYVLRIEIHPMFVDRLNEYYSSFCSTDLNVPVYVGFMIEFLAVIYESWFSSQTFSGHSHVDMIIKIINSGLLVVGGVHLTGMYIHPAMATGHTWGCGDTTRTSHILIYWVGPIIGVWLSIELQKRFSLRKFLKETAAGTSKSHGKAHQKNGGKSLANGTGSYEDKKKQNGGRRKFYHGKKYN